MFAHITSAMLLTMDQMSYSIAILAIRKEGLKMKLHDCPLVAG